MTKCDIKEAKRFISYMLEYLSYGYIEFDGGEWHVYTPRSSFIISFSKKGYSIWREAEDGQFFKQETLDSLTFALFRCYFRDYCKEHNIKVNAELYDSFYKQYMAYLIVKRIEGMVI